MLDAATLTLPQMEDALLGGGLPPEAHWRLQQAANAYRHEAVAERHLHEAMAIAPAHPAVLIGLYRFYFYKGRLREALDIACTCLEQTAYSLGVAADWRQVNKRDAYFGSYAARLPRFYMFTLKAYAYLQLRLGAIAEGQEAVSKLLELDPTDKVGAGVLLNVLQRVGQPDED